MVYETHNPHCVGIHSAEMMMVVLCSTPKDVSFFGFSAKTHVKEALGS